MEPININEKILVGVSGGPDSMYLLNYLLNRGYKNLIVCHVNYHYRLDSNIDQKIVSNFCEEHNLSFFLKELDSQIYQNLNNNFESFARKTRYDFFCDIGIEQECVNLFIAHNQNDLIETYLLQKQRNSLVDYYGLREESSYKNLLILRPLLDLKKSEILKFNEQQKIAYAIDSTNLDTSFKRNFIRKNLKEEDFPKYLQMISLDNQKNETQKEIAKNYVNQNLKKFELNLSKSFFNYDIHQTMFILINYFKKIFKDDLLFNRANATLKEISKELLESNKNFLKIQIGDYYLVKDYDKIYLKKASWFKLFSYEINDEKDFLKLNGLTNKEDLIKVMENDNFQFPYLITNDFGRYKLKTYVCGKRTNRYFIDKKIRYKKRFKTPALIRLKNQSIINYNQF